MGKTGLKRILQVSLQQLDQDMIKGIKQNKVYRVRNLENIKNLKKHTSSKSVFIKALSGLKECKVEIERFEDLPVTMVTPNTSKSSFSRNTKTKKKLRTNKNSMNNDHHVKSHAVHRDTEGNKMIPCFVNIKRLPDFTITNSSRHAIEGDIPSVKKQNTAWHLRMRKRQNYLYL